MSETLNNNTESAGDTSGYAATMEDAPKFDPEAAAQAREEYEASHPKAVSDVEKARVMAEAEDPYMEQAIDVRDAARGILNGEKPDSEGAKELEDAYNKSIKMSGDAAPTVEQQMAGQADYIIDQKIRQADKAAERAATDYDYKKQLDDTMNRRINRL